MAKLQKLNQGMLYYAKDAIVITLKKHQQ